MLDTWVLEVVAELEQMCAPKRTDVVHTPAIPLVFERKGHLHLAHYVLLQVGYLRRNATIHERNGLFHHGLGSCQVPYHCGIERFQDVLQHQRSLFVGTQLERRLFFDVSCRQFFFGVRLAMCLLQMNCQKATRFVGRVNIDEYVLGLALSDRP